MKKMIMMLAGVVGLFTVQIAQAETLHQGGRYAGGSVVEIAAYGFHITIPRHWRGDGQSDSDLVLHPPRGEAIMLMQFFPSKDMLEFDRVIQRNPVLVNQKNFFVQAVSHHQAIDAYATFDLHGQMNGKPLIGVYAAGDLAPFMSYTNMLVMPSYEWSAWNQPPDRQYTEMVEQRFEMENSLIEQAKKLKANADRASRQASSGSSDSSSSDSGSSSNSNGNNEHFSSGPDGQSSFSTHSNGCSYFSGPGGMSFNTCD